MLAKSNGKYQGFRPEFEGKCIAKKLLLKVIEAARAKNVKITPLCSYARKVLNGKEEYADVV